MHLIQHHKPPLTTHDEIHHLLAIVRALRILRHHAVRADRDTGLVVQSLLLAGGEDGDVFGVDVGPFLELFFPLDYAHGARAEDDGAFFDGAGSCDAD